MVSTTEEPEKINDEELVVDVGLRHLMEDIVHDQGIPDDPIYNAFLKSITDTLAEIPMQMTVGSFCDRWYGFLDGWNAAEKHFTIK